MMDTTFDDANFDQEVLQSPDVVLIDFWAPWCGPCRMQGPIVEDLAHDYEGKAIKIGKLNVDDAPNVASRYQILSIPTIMFFKAGQPVFQFVGVQDKKTLSAKVDQLLS